MHILSINIGSARTIGNANVSGQTGIYKLPVAGPVQVTADGLADDAIVDTKNHGGPDQAVYVYGGADYAWWAAELGRELAPGTFGENLTICDLESAALAIGDRLHIGGVILEVTAPRIPCWKLAQRMGDPGFVKRFRAAERPGCLLPRGAGGDHPGRRSGDVGAVCGRAGDDCRGLPRLLRAGARSGGHPPLSWPRRLRFARAPDKEACSFGKRSERMQDDE